MGGCVTAGEATIRVEAGTGGYEVVVTRSLDGLGTAARRALGSVSRVMLVTDTNVVDLHADDAASTLERAGFEVARCVLPAGEEHKTVATWAGVLDAAIAAGIDRGQAFVALGGGVVGDLTGFAAATLARGVPFVQVPTTLLSAVDASVGGKTAVDHSAGKNLIGAFHPPALVWTATDALATQPSDVWRAGWAEVVKHAALDGCLASVLPWRTEADGVAAAIRHSVTYKAAIVGRDEREHGVRAWLNLGHTVAHGIETAAGHRGWSHGAAVAVGLVAEAAFAARQGWAAPSVTEALRSALTAVGLPTALPPSLRAGALVAMAHDKKRSSGSVRLPYLAELGRPEIAAVALDQLAMLWPEET
jgi:3-dehydroquinate synthase